MFTIIAWIIIGRIAGAIARLILPGRQGSGWLGALITGLLGAVLGGWISTLLGGEGLGDAFSWQTLIWMSLIHISEPTRRTERSRMPSSA